jgi:hypothetical protein
MEPDDIYSGMIVRVIVWDYRPDHWEEEGRMDDWQGAVVTVADFISDVEEVYIEDDEGEWIWYPSDFEIYHTLPQTDPNILYKKVKHQAWIDELRRKAGIK